jgi:hypothetical protein
MSYKDEYHPRVKADLKKLDKIAVKEIHSTQIDILLENPFTAECLYGFSRVNLTILPLSQNI